MGARASWCPSFQEMKALAMATMMLHCINRFTILSWFVVALCIGALAPRAAHAQKADDDIREFVGVWDLPGTLTQVKINADRTVDHSSLGSGTIALHDVGVYRVTYRHLHLNCYYQIKRYGPDELAVVVATQPSEQDCDLGTLRRAPGSSKHGAAAAGGKDVASLPPTSVFKDCPECPDMVVVPAGSFQMGSREDEAGRYEVEGPVHTVTFDRPFAVSRYAITLEQFETFTKEKRRPESGGCRVQGKTDWEPVPAATFRQPGFPQAPNHPVVCVSWQDAVDYAAWMSERTGHQYRLLSEAEFEYVARAGTAAPYWWGPTADAKRANYDARTPQPMTDTSSKKPGKAKPDAAVGQAQSVSLQTSHTGTVPVQYFSPNPWGIFQPHGNAASWVSDCWSKTLAGAPADGAAASTGNCNRRTVRGGAWTSDARDMRAAYRESAPAEQRYYQIGFRIARNLNP